MRVRELARDERPREKLLESGAVSCSNAELLAVLLRTGTRNRGVLEFAQEWLSEVGGLLGLSRLSPSQILEKRGVGKAKAAALIAALELSRRLAAEEMRLPESLTSPEAVYRLLAPAFLRERTEVFGLLTLDVRNRLIREHVLHRGVRDGAGVEPAEVFHRAILDNAHGVILWHTHPSGDPAPSPDDVALTRTLVEAGKILRIAVVDHVVVGAGGYRSLRQMGVLP